VAACVNAGDQLKVFAFFSFPFLALTLFEGTSYDDLAQSAPSETQGTAVEGIIWDVRLQADGRVTAKIEEGGVASLYTFVRENGRWLIDEINRTAIIESAPRG